VPSSERSSCSEHKAGVSAAQVDEDDIKILAALLEDASEPVSSIAKRLGMPTSTVFARIKKLEKMGVIRGYTVKVNPQALGYTVTAAILMSVEGPYLEEVEHEVAKSKNVLALYDVTGEFDVLVIARFKSIAELDRFIKGLLKNPRIKRTTTSVVLRVVKEECPSVPGPE